MLKSNKAKIIISAEDKTKQAFDSVKRNVGAATALIGTALVAGMLAAVKQTAELNDEMIKTAQAVGTTTESLSGLKFAAQLGGVEFEEISKSLAKLSKTTEDYRDGLTTAVDAFDKLKLDPTKFNDSTELFEALAEELSKLPDGAQKTAIAMALLGRSGGKLIPLMNGGAKAIKAARQEAEELGVVITTQNARASERLLDDMTRISAAFSGFKQAAANNVIPALADVSEEMVNAVKEGKELKAVILGIAGIGRIPIDFFFPVEGIKVDSKSIAADLEKKIRIETTKLNRLESTGGGILNRLVAGGAPDEIKRKITILKNQLEGFKKFGDKLDAQLNRKKDGAGVDTVDAPPINLPGSTSGLDKQRKAIEKMVAQFEKAVKPAQAQSEILQETLNSYGKLDPAVRRYLQGLQQQVEANEQLKKSTEEWLELENLQRASDDEALRQLEATSAAEETRKESLEAQAKAVRELFDPSLKLLEIESQYLTLLNDGLITQEEYTFAIEKAAEAHADFVNKGKDSFEELKQEIEGFSKDAADALTDFLTDGEANFGDFVNSILEDMARLAVKRNITDPLFSGLGDILSPDDGGEGGIASFFASIFGGFRASGGPVLSNKAYVVGESGPELLTGASGRIIPNNALGGGSNVQLNIYGAPSQPTIKKREADDGSTNIDVIFDMVKGEMVKDVRSEGPFAQAMQGTYALNRAGGGL